MTLSTKEMSEALEAFIDANGLVAVAVALELLCMDKAAHVQENWQDKALAKEWQAADRAFHAIALKFNKSVIG